jgi:choline-sulfatase
MKPVRPANLLFLLSDEHTRGVLRCYGNTQVHTPHLDRLAAGGTRFSGAYCNSPICVPSRASLATGCYVHEIGCWDNAHPYDGTFPSWGHRLIEAGHEAVAIGKLHYRSAKDPTGFSDEIDTLHVVDGVGDLYALLRKDLSPRASCAALAQELGRGESAYTRFDAQVTARACAWLRARARAAPSKPWVLFIGYLCPHFPLLAPPAFYDLYDAAALPRPRERGRHRQPLHPHLEQLRTCMNYDDYFDDDAVERAVAGYYGLVSFLDTNIGALLETLEHTGLAAETRVLYTSDHGECLGNRGIWGKGVMYEESVGVPLILNGPDVPAGRTVPTLVSLVDCFPTILAGAGLLPIVSSSPVRGESLFDIAAAPDRERTVFSEYHAEGSASGVFMLRNGPWKYIHYETYLPQLFHLPTDPQETRDLAHEPAYRNVLTHCDRALRDIADPTAVNRRAFADQARAIDRFGGAEGIRRRSDIAYTPATG